MCVCKCGCVCICIVYVCVLCVYQRNKNSDKQEFKFMLCLHEISKLPEITGKLYIQFMTTTPADFVDFRCRQELKN